MGRAERFRAPPAGLSPAARISWCLCLSLLLHGLALVVSAALSVPRSAATPLPALNVRLAMKKERGEAPPARRSPDAVGVATRPRQTVQSAPARPLLPLEKDVVAPAEPQPRTPPSFELDDLRAQARSLARGPPESLVRGPGVHRNLAPAADQAALDRPFLDALARRLGKTQGVTSEQVMSDGSRLIRFADNTCLRIPQHLPEWQKNPMGPTVLVATNCL